MGIDLNRANTLLIRLHEWMNEWMNGWMNEWMDEWMFNNTPEQK